MRKMDFISSVLALPTVRHVGELDDESLTRRSSGLALLRLAMCGRSAWGR